MPEPKRPKGPLTIYDVASRAGVSIASVSRVLNSQGTPRASTRERVMRAVTELGFVPDGAARALSNGLKEVVGVVFRRGDETHFEDEDESLLFIDVINRGIDVAAQRRGFDVLMSSVGFNDQNATTRISGVAGKADGIILHDRMLPAARRAWTWSLQHPDATFHNPPGVFTGEYGDSDCSDERLWAASMPR